MSGTDGPAITTFTMWAVSVVAALALAGCGIGDDVALPSTDASASFERPSRTPETPSPSVAVPTAEPEPSRSILRPTRTQEPTPESSTPTPTSQTPTEPGRPGRPSRLLSLAATTLPPTSPATTKAATPTTPTPTGTSESTQAPTPSATGSPSETFTSGSATPSISTATTTVTASASPEASESSDSGLPVWLVLAALAAAGAGLAWFLIAGSRRRDWEARLEVERTQSRWVVEELLPAVVDPATPSEQVVGHWAAAQDTIDALEANLAELVTDAPDDSRALLARSIASAVSQVRSSATAHVTLVGGLGVDPQARAASAAAVRTAGGQLEATLAPPA